MLLLTKITLIKYNFVFNSYLIYGTVNDNSIFSESVNNTK